MLASVYSYRVMVKSVSSCCVRGRRVLSNPVTYLIAIFNFLVQLTHANLFCQVLIMHFTDQPLPIIVCTCTLLYVLM